eukprot:TRINITY_DN7520_c0_g1_i1.p2 TRINITY_DN7520_c0_g1~~TRINITY_DN7520_c0_g1_i1.p2  ORF type:complete len:63 (-),score=2.88 TRINITY_DN7520_c0_g1_i1:424-612(-)
MVSIQFTIKFLCKICKKLVENEFFSKKVTSCEKRSCSITLISNKDEFNQVVHMILCDFSSGL